MAPRRSQASSALARPEVALDPVQGLGLGRPGRRWWFLRHRFLQRPSRPSQSASRRHPPPPAVAARYEQLQVHPGRAVSAVGIFVESGDLLGQLGLRFRPPGQRGLASCAGTWRDGRPGTLSQQCFTLRPSASSTSMEPSSFTGSPLRRTLAYFWLGDPGKCIRGNRSSHAPRSPSGSRP